MQFIILMELPLVVFITSEKSLIYKDKKLALVATVYGLVTKFDINNNYCTQPVILMATFTLKVFTQCKLTVPFRVVFRLH